MPLRGRQGKPLSATSEAWNNQRGRRLVVVTVRGKDQPSSRAQRPEADWKADPRFAHYVELFDRREFFRAHEVLEELWLEYRGVDRSFLQGLIQLSVSLEHLARTNPRGAAKVLGSARRRLAGYPKTHRGIPIGRLLERIDSYLEGKRQEPPPFPSSRAAAGAREQPQPQRRRRRSS